MTETNLPRKNTARFMWAGFSLFIVYGTTFPFSFDAGFGLFLAKIQSINWLLLGGKPGNPVVSDIIQNILLFIPFGFLGYFSIIHKRSWLKKFGIVLAGVSLSGLVEFLQLFAPSRFTTLSDVIFNGSGTAIGLFAAILLKKSLLGFKSNPKTLRYLQLKSFFPTMVFLVLIVASSWEPFDFTLDVSMVWGHIKRLIREPFHLFLPNSELIDFIRYLVASLFASRLLKEAGFRRPYVSTLLAMGLLAVALEGSQFFITSRSPEIDDILVAWFGCLWGAGLIFLPAFKLRPYFWTIVGTGCLLASVTVQAFYPFTFSPTWSGFNWTLFFHHYNGVAFSAMSDFIESNLAYFPLGFLFCSLLPQARASSLALVVSGTFALVIEFGQGFVMGRFSDVTDVLGAILGTLAGSLVVKRGWPAFEAYIRQIGDPQV